MIRQCIDGINQEDFLPISCYWWTNCFCNKGKIVRNSLTICWICKLKILNLVIVTTIKSSKGPTIINCEKNLLLKIAQKSENWFKFKISSEQRCLDQTWVKSSLPTKEALFSKVGMILAAGMETDSYWRKTLIFMKIERIRWRRRKSKQISEFSVAFIQNRIYDRFFLARILKQYESVENFLIVFFRVVSH